MSTMNDIINNMDLITFQNSIGLNGCDLCSTNLPFALYTLNKFIQAEQFNPPSTCPTSLKNEIKDLFQKVWAMNNAGQSITTPFQIINDAVENRYS